MSTLKSIPKALRNQLELPVSIDKNGQMVTLEDFVRNKSGFYLSLSSLTLEQKAKLTAERFRREPEVKLGMIGAGEIDKSRAIAEIEAVSPIGLALMEADQYYIEALIEELKNGRFKDILN